MFERDIVEQMWDILKVYIPEKEKQVAADHVVTAIVDMDIPEAAFKSFVQSDHHLEIAAAEYIEDEDEDEDEDW